MTPRFAILVAPNLAAALVAVVITGMAAQAPWPGWPGPPPAGFSATSGIADQHRLEMDRLRNQAAEREAFAQQLRSETRRALQDLQATRQPAPLLPPVTPYAPSSERAWPERQRPEMQRHDGVRSVTEIDAWLDRKPD